VPTEHDLLQILVFENADQVGYVRLHTDVRSTKVLSLAHTGKGRRPDLVAMLAERIGDRTPLPTATPPTVNEDDVRDRRNCAMDPVHASDIRSLAPAKDSSPWRLAEASGLGSNRATVVASCSGGRVPCSAALTQCGRLVVPSSRGPSRPVDVCFP
jgi:hypothetical protein